MFLGDWIVAFADFVWGVPLVVLLVGGGLYFLIYSRGLPYRYFGHAIKILLGKYDDKLQPGQINQFQAVSTALASTIGMGNISGVAVAISIGGPGAVFWMWISALIGMSTKFFTCTLSVMFRSKDSKGNPIGGPMYYIVEGLGKKWRPMAVFFSVVGMIGVLPVFQANQLARIIGFSVFPEMRGDQETWVYLTLGILISIPVMLVLFGGIKRIATVASTLVPFMVVLYFIAVSLILILHVDTIIPSFVIIFTDAFTGDAAAGGVMGAVILMGVRRAAFSNEAGIGTAPMAHGEARSSEPIREGFAAMTEPFIDTIIVCTLTALAIISTGAWQNTEFDGIRVTAIAFESGLPYIGSILLTICVTIFSVTSLFAFPYYGAKCFGFLFGEETRKYYEIFYCFSIVAGAVLSLGVVISIADAAYGLMAVPNMIAALLLAPHVRREAIKYTNKYLKNKSVRKEI